MTAANQATRFIAGYIMHDPIGNVEGFITNYDPDVLQEAEDDGMVLIAQYSDGARELVKAQDVSEPKMPDIDIVAPSYVDKRTDATVAVFDALAAIVDPQAATLSADDAAGQADPVAAFKDALAKLRALKAQA